MFIELGTLTKSSFYPQKYTLLLLNLRHYLDDTAIISNTKAGLHTSGHPRNVHVCLYLYIFVLFENY